MDFLTPRNHWLAAVAAAACMPIAALAQSVVAPADTVERPAPNRAAIETVSAAVKATPAADLRVTSYSKNISHDGVVRESTHTNRIYRRTTPTGGWVWTERELPEALKHSQTHGHEHKSGPHAGHAHDEANGAPLRVTRHDDGWETVEVILAQTRRVITVELAHQGNVGYAGSWGAQYWIVPPAALKAMQPVGSAKNGVQRYRQVAGEQTTVVDWDQRGQYPRLIERKDEHGTTYTRVRIERIAAPNPGPWLAAEKFDLGDYSDLLD